MTREQYLLQCLQEECAEVVQIASKYNRFGPESFSPADPEKRTNRAKLTQEVIDLMALVQAVGMNGLLLDQTPKDAEQGIQAKLTRLDKYMEISEQLGYLQKDPKEQDLAPVAQFKTTD